MSDSKVNTTAGPKDEDREPAVSCNPMKDNHAHVRGREGREGAAISWIDSADWMDPDRRDPRPSTEADLFTRAAMIDAFVAGWETGEIVARPVISAAAEAFRFYEAHHREKLAALQARPCPVGEPAFKTLMDMIDEAEAKVTRNQRLAEQCEAWMNGPVAAVDLDAIVDAVARSQAEAGAHLFEDGGVVPGGPRRGPDDVVVQLAVPGVYSREQAERLARHDFDKSMEGRGNLRPITSGPLADPDVLEGLMASAGMIDAVEGAPHRLEGVADLVAFRLTTGDPRFDPEKPVTVNGYLYRPVAKET